MEYKGFNSDDYIYLQILENLDTKNINERWNHLKKDDVIRLHKNEINYKSDIMDFCFHDGLKEALDITDETWQEFLEGKRTTFTFQKDFLQKIEKQPNSIYVCNDWFLNKVQSIRNISFPVGNNDVLFQQDFERCVEPIVYNMDAIEKQGILRYHVFKAYYTFHLFFYYKKGEVLDFSNPSVFLLYSNQEYLNLLTSSKKLMDQAKDQAFVEDFKNVILTPWFFDASRKYKFVAKYYKLNKDICLKAKIGPAKRYSCNQLLDTIENLKQYQNVFLGTIDDHLLFYSPTYDIDKNGFVRYVCLPVCDEMNSSLAQNTMLKIAKEVKYKEATERFSHLDICADSYKSLGTNYFLDLPLMKYGNLVGLIEKKKEPIKTLNKNLKNS